MTIPLEFGCVKDLYVRGKHPRMLLAESDLAHLRQWTQTGIGKKILSGLRRKAEVLVPQILTCPDLPAQVGNLTRERKGGTPLGQTITGNLDNVAMIGLLDGNTDAIEAVRRVLTSGPGAIANDGNVAFAYDLVQSRISDADRAVFCGWAVEEIKRNLALIRPTYEASAGGNISMSYMLNALWLLLAIDGDPGVPDLSLERARLVRCFEAAVYSAIGPEGYPAEDIGYGTLMVARLARAASCLRRAGIYDAYASNPRLTRFGRAMLHFVQPWGQFLSNTGDHGDDFGARDLVLGHLAQINGDATLVWLMMTLSYPCLDPEERYRIEPLARETELAPGMQVPNSSAALIALADAPPPVDPADFKPALPTAFKDSDRGIVSFRSGWHPGDTFVYLDGSQRPTSAQGHAHDSGGHFCLSARGEYFAVSPGRYGIDQDQHNVMLVDGKSGRTTDGQWRASYYQARLIAYRPGPLCDFASVDNTVQANCFWSVRHLGLVKGNGLPSYAWTVDDVNGANDLREFWWTLNTAPGNSIEIDGSRARVKGRRHGGVLDVHFVYPPKEAYPTPHTLSLTQDVAVTSSHKYIANAEAVTNSYRGVHHATYFRPRLVARLRGYNGRLLTLMLPRSGDEVAAEARELTTVPGALAVRIQFPGVWDTIIFAYNNHLLQADGIEARGKWIVVRRSDNDRRVLGVATEDADWVKIDGRKVIVE